MKTEAERRGMKPLPLRVCLSVERSYREGSRWRALRMWWDDQARYRWGRTLDCGCVTALGRIRLYTFPCPDHFPEL